MTTSFLWHRVWPAPETLPVRQVYAWILDEAGRVLLIDMPGGWNLPGGTPEDHDADWQATLRREVLEEADVTLSDVVPLGYQEVRADDAEPFAQLRVAARVAEWREATQDPDSGLVYPRVWVPLDRAAGLLGWGEPGRAQAAAAAQVACEVYGFVAAAAVAQGASAVSTPVMQRV
ncbi:NUDIX hydrolase [Streptomyces sp. B1866]|uniref:NUDIX hydrolase n=1 Tax=Streptomyces sp. B1866 TaxID=3075431 RepID=UPI0028985691|nr:NUDIX hydrolase [Streptomyces sp. B1866]